MAESLAHTFGQIIGNVLEDAIEPALQKFADEHGLDCSLIHKVHSTPPLARREFIALQPATCSQEGQCRYNAGGSKAVNSKT